MKQFFQSPLFKVICLAWYVSTLINKVKGLSHYTAVFNYGYKAGYVVAIGVWVAAIVMMSIKLPSFSFIKR